MLWINLSLKVESGCTSKSDVHVDAGSFVVKYSSRVKHILILYNSDVSVGGLYCVWL